MSEHHRQSHASTGADQAAAWVLRHDRGLTPSEQDEFSQWLAADPQHRAAFAEQRAAWETLELLAGLPSAAQDPLPDPDLFAPRRKRRRLAWLPVVALAAAAAVAVAFFVAPRGESIARVDPEATPSSTGIASLEERTLSDGSIVTLNRGCILTEHFTPGERRVRLEQGEAHFAVAHDTRRPFIVEAGKVAVRAVGTAFNVRLGNTDVEVLVNEGRVGVANTIEGRSLLVPSANAEPPVLVAGQQATVGREADGAAQVVSLTIAEVTDRLRWQHRLLDFTDAPLTEIIAAFNRRNPVQLTLAPSVGEMRLSATFRSDNVEGFVRLMESDFGLRAERRGATEIVLDRTK